MLVVNPRTVPAQTFPEFVALAKANPGKYFYASTGSGTSSHLSGVLLNLQAGLDLTHVPYKGAVALNDVLSGESVQCMFATIPSAIQLVRGGKLRALAVTSLQRSGGVPDVPTIAESGYPRFRRLLLVRPRRPGRPAARDRAEDPGRGRAHPQGSRRCARSSSSRAPIPIGNTPDEFGQYIRDETAKWAKIVKASGAQAD